MTAIIIGANSYIARNLIYYLKKKTDINIIGLYDYNEVQFDSEEPYKQIDILSQEGTSVINMNADLIFMFVGKTGSQDGFSNFKTFININEISLLNILNEYQRQNSKAKIIFPSTRLVYKGSEKPLKEDSEKEFKTVYAINKFSCEQYLKQFKNVFGINYLILRICVPYGTMIEHASSYGTAEFMLGKAQNGKDITLYGDGLQRRSITYIEDLCETFYKAALSNDCLNDVFNIGGEDYSLQQIANLIAAKYNVNVKHIEWPSAALRIESGSTVFDDIKLKNIIGNTIKYKFTDWIKEGSSIT